MIPAQRGKISEITAWRLTWAANELVHSMNQLTHRLNVILVCRSWLPPSCLPAPSWYYFLMLNSQTFFLPAHMASRQAWNRICMSWKEPLSWNKKPLIQIWALDDITNDLGDVIRNVSDMCSLTSLLLPHICYGIR